jgi:hypothetical protein
MRRYTRLLKSKQAADSRALALATTIRELMAAGFVSQCDLTNELNRRGIPAAHGGGWHYTTVRRVLIRLKKTSKRNIALTNNQAADARAMAMASIIRAIQATGVVSFSAIARDLNEREITTARGSNWHPSSVSKLLYRLKRLEPSSRTSPAG